MVSWPHFSYHIGVSKAVDHTLTSPGGDCSLGRKMVIRRNFFRAWLASGCPNAYVCPTCGSRTSHATRVCACCSRAPATPSLSLLLACTLLRAYACMLRTCWRSACCCVTTPAAHVLLLACCCAPMLLRTHTCSGAWTWGLPPHMGPPLPALASLVY
jgi:hypothetical protein